LKDSNNIIDVSNVLRIFTAAAMYARQITNTADRPRTYFVIGVHLQPSGYELSVTSSRCPNRQNICCRIAWKYSKDGL